LARAISGTPPPRALFDHLFELEEARKRSSAHEARWLHLCGFCLRPGTGAPLDDWRSKQMWRIFNEDLVHPRAEQSRLAWWITWRRIAGGLSKGQQHQIYLRLAQLFLPGARAKQKWDEVKPSPEEAAEMLRCLANLERLSPEAKIPLGDELCRRMESRKVREEGLTLWALSRLGARVPLYGPLNCVVPASKAAAWLTTVLGYEWPQPAKIAFSVAQIARRTGDRARDLDDESRTRTTTWLREAGADRAAILVAEVVTLEAREEHIALGDTLPPGLHLVGDLA
jgi:DNA-K related protein